MEKPDQRSGRKSLPEPMVAPCPVFPHGKDGNFQTFYNICDDPKSGACDKFIPELSRQKSCYQGWLVTVCDEEDDHRTPRNFNFGDCFLWNPASMESIQLPSVLYWYSLGDEYCAKDCVVSSAPRSTESDDNVGDDSIVCFLFGTRRGVGKNILVYCHPGDEEWRTHKITDIYDVGDLRSMRYCKGKIHIICGGNEHLEIDIQHGLSEHDVGLAIAPLKSKGAKLENEQTGSWEASAKGEGNATLGVKFAQEVHSDNSSCDFSFSETVASLKLASPSEGPGSINNLSEKCEGVGVESFSRLSGLGIGARRQLATILDDFWEQLFDFHGQASPKSKAKKLDVLFGQKPKPTAPLNVGAPVFVPSTAERVSELQANSNSYDLPNKRGMLSSLTSPNGIQSRSHLLDTQLADAFSQSLSLNGFDYGEKRYSSLRVPPVTEGLGKLGYQQPTKDDCQTALYFAPLAAEIKNLNSLNGHLDPPTSHSPYLGPPNYMDQLHALPQKPLNSYTSVNMQNPAVFRHNGLFAEHSYYNGPYSSGLVQDVGPLAFTEKYHCLPSHSGLALPRQGPCGTGKSSLWDSYGPSFYSDSGSTAGVPLAYNQVPLPNPHTDRFPGQLSPLEAKSMWSLQPFEQLCGIKGIPQKSMGNEFGSKSTSVTPETSSHSESELETVLLQLFRRSMTRLLKLEPSEWLFRLNGGADEDLIGLVAARERFHDEAETGEVTHRNETSESPLQYLSSDELLSTVPNCGESCIWRKDLIVSFGVWCIRRALELALVEKRPELWGMYTYVLNRLQGILEPAFSKPRTPLRPCLCLQIPVTKRSSTPLQGDGVSPPAAKSGTGESTTASTVIDIVENVKTAISNRGGKSGTAAGDVAFPLGKRNLTPVLKRYRRHLSNIMLQTHEGGAQLT